MRARSWLNLSPLQPAILRTMSSICWDADASLMPTLCCGCVAPSPSIAHRSFDAVEGSVEVGAVPSAGLIADLVRVDAGQRAEIILGSRDLDQPSEPGVSDTPVASRRD